MFDLVTLGTVAALTFTVGFTIAGSSVAAPASWLPPPRAPAVDHVGATESLYAQ